MVESSSVSPFQAKENEVASNYGLQLAATLLSDENTVACGDQISGISWGWRVV